MKKQDKNRKVKLLCFSDNRYFKGYLFIFSYNYEVFGECITTYTFFRSIAFLQCYLRFKTLVK